MNEFDGENQDDAFYQSSGSAYREEVVPRSRGPNPITSRDIVEMFGGSGASLPTPKPAPAPVAQPVARDKPITSQDIVAMFAGSPADEVVEQPKPAKEPGLDISGGLAKGFKGLKVTWDYLANRLEKAVTGKETDTKDILAKSAEEYGKLQSDPRLAELIRLGDEAPNTAAAVGDMLWYAIKNPTLVANFLAEQAPGVVAGGGIGSVVTAPARAAAVGAATRLGASQAVTGFVGKGVTGAGINTGAVTLQSLGSNYVEGLQKYDGDTEAASQYAVTKTAAEVPANAVAGAFLGFAPFASKFANIGTQVAIQGAGGATGAFQAAEAVGEKASRGEMILEFLGEGAFAPVDILLSRFGDKKKSEGDNINDIRNRMNVPEGRKEIWDTLNTDPKIAQIIKDVGLESPADPNFDEVVAKVVDIARVKEAVEQISPKTPEEIREERKARQEEVAAAFRDTASTGVGVGVGTPVEGVIRRESVQVDEQGRQLVPIGEKPDQVLIANEQGVSTPAVSGEDIVAAQQGFKPLPGTKIGATPWANRFLNARQAQANIDTLETGNELEAKLEAHRKGGNVFDKEALSAARTQLNDLRVRFGLPRITKWKQPIQPIFPDLSAQDVQIRQGKRSKEAGGGDFFFLEARPLPSGTVKPERVQTKTPAPATPATPAAPASTVGVPGASQTPSGQAPTQPATQTEGTTNAAQEGNQQQGSQQQREGTGGRLEEGRDDRQQPAQVQEASGETGGGNRAQEGGQGAVAGVILQNRNRATPASVAQMTSIGSQPDYGRLGFSRDFANGAPVVFGGNIPESQMGKRDYAVAQDGRKIDIRYAVVEADQVLASNRADGTPNPAYGNPEVEGIRAVAGNGRIAGLQNAYENDRAAAYKQELAKDDLHGVSEKVIVGMDSPVLVRVMSAKDLTQDIGDVSNIAAGLGLSAVEQAKNDANRVNLEDLTFTEDGRASNKTVTEFVRSMPASEQGTLIDTNGIPTTQAVDRLNAAIFSGAYQNDELVRLYAQAQDPEARLVLSSLAQIAPKMVRLQGAGDLDFRAAVATAAEAVVNGKRLGLTLDEIARQRDITVSDPAVTDILELFARNPKSVKPVVRALSRAADVALQEANKPAQDMFGATPKMSRQDIIGNLKQFETDQAGLDLRRVIADGFETIEDLNKKAQSLLDPTKGEVFRAVRVPVGDLVGKVPGLGLIQKSASLFGKEVVFFRVEEGKNIFDGAVIRGGNKIFVNVTSTKPHLRIVGHEMVHALRRSNPAAYDRLVNSLQPMLDQKGFASYTELLKSEGMKTADKILEEAIGDIVGDRFGESEFWQMMADRNPTGFKQFAREIIAFIDNILKKIGVNTLGSETLVKDLKSARAEIVRILSDVGQETKAAGQGIDLSRSRDNRDTTSIMSSSKEDARMALGLGAKKNVVRRIAEALNQRTIDAGLAIDRKNYSDAAVEALGESLFNEVAFHLQTDKSENGTGLGWYSYNYPRALDLLSERFPELKKNAAARNLFTALVAITSNGEKVTLNVANAIRLYEAYRNGGRFQDAEIGVKRKQALKANMAELEKLIDAHGLDGLRGYLLKEITVAEMNATLRAMGEKSDGSYKADTIVPTAAIHFGPKLGAFYANLSGSEGYLTMDMWWTRTMNRLRGLLIPKATPQSLARLKELVGDPKLSRDELLDIAVDAAQRYEDHGYWTALEWATGSKEPGKKGPKLVWMEQAKKAAGPAFDAMLQEHNIEKASNTIYKREFKALQEAPFNASDREFMYKVAKYAQDKLKKEGKDLSIADIQAAIWYYEKRLYEKLSGRTADDIGYEEALAGQAAGYRPERPSIRFAGATDGGQGPGRGVPASVGTRQEDSGGARKKPAEVTQQTPPEGGVSVSDISLSRAREAREIAPIAGQENSGTTQVATTAGSYKKAARAILDAAPDAANVLDYGAGLGIGTDALREVFGDRVTVESYEPFPQRWAGDRPVDYTRSNEIPGKYDAVVNLNVLNVLEPGLRDQVARDIADKLAPGGVAVIGTRKWTGDISTAKNVEKAAEDKAVYVVRRAGGEDVRVYQKGFDGRELVDYLSGLLGDGFTVSQGSGIAANTAIIKRQSADQDISLSRARVAEAVSSASVPGPFAQAVRDRIASAILPSGEQRFNWWHKSIGTQLEKARVNPYFRKVYDLGQKFLDDTAMFAMRAQAAAPTILPNLGNMGLRFWKGGISKANNELLGKMLAEGTLLNGPSPMNGKIWTDAELRSRYNATDEQIKLYREARAAIDQSLDDTTKALMGQLARSGGIPQSAIDPLMEAQLPLSAVRDRLVKALQALPSTGKVQTAINGVKKMASETEAMKKGGYAPLMRFGEFVVSVENAKGDVEYFSLHETAADALRTRNEITKQFKGPGFKVSNPGARLNSARFKMFAGLSPSTLEAFFNAVPVTSKAEENLRQEYLQLVVSNRSALARMIQRKGTAGYTLDATRTLASFITSNARHSSKALNMAEISRAITQIPAEQGDVADEAVKLQEYLQNPQEGVPGIRGFLFFNFLGGSIAAGLVNMTQPVLMTYPYLTQWGAGRASSAMSNAMKDATAHLLKKPTGNKALDAALKKAAERGITQPQEMFQLIAAAESGTSSLLGHKFMRVWGLNFAVSEVFNRVVTFTAAFNLGSTLSQAELQKAGVKDAFEFAVRTVEDTQGKYNKGNRPNWARETGVLGSAGTLMFTFKQYSIAYMEFLKQLYKNDKNGKKALGIALGTLILAAGLSGLPGADDLDDLIDTVGNWMGYPTNSKKWKVKFLTETLGLSTQSANFLLYGVSSFLPMDLQARLGLANLIPGTGLLNPTRDNKAREVLDVIGPLGGFAANAADAVEMTAKGNFRGAGMKLAPKAVKDAYQGFEMATTGVVRDEKGRTIQEATATEAVVKGIGFNPQSVASEARVQRMIQADIDIVKSKKEELHEQMARAIVDRDEDLKDKVLDELSRWNSGDPEYRIKLDTKAIQARVKKMIIDRSQRFAQQAPKDMRARIIRDLQEQKDARN